MTGETPTRLSRDPQQTAAEAQQQPAPERQWSIAEGVYQPGEHPVDPLLVKDIQYAYAHMDPVVQKRSVDNDLSVYALQLAQPQLFEDPASKAVARKAIWEAVEACMPYDDPKALLDRLQEIASEYLLPIPGVISALEDFPVDNSQLQSLEAIAYYITLKQSGADNFLPPQP